MAEPQQDKELEAHVQKMMESGSSRDEITSFIQQYDDLSHPIKAVMGGAVEGVVPGIVDAITAPWSLAKGAIEDLYNVGVKGGSAENTRALSESFKELPAQWDKAGVRERTKMVTELLTTLGVGYGAAKYGPATVKGPTKVLGRGMESVAKREWPLRFLGSATGRALMPEMPGVGMVTGAALPEMMRKGGGILRRAAGDIPEDLNKVPSGTRNIDVKGPVKGIRVMPPAGSSTKRVPYGGTSAEASGRVQKVMAGETREAEKAATAAAKAQENAERLATIEAAKEGLEPGKPSISESVSATTPEGGRTSMSTRFKKPGTDVDPRIAELKKRYPNITDEALRKALGSDPGVLSPLGGPTRPAIRVTEPKPRVQAEQENIGRSGATYGEGGIVPGPMPTELTPEPVTPPSRGTYTQAEGVSAIIPHDLTIEGEEGINPPGPTIGTVPKPSKRPMTDVPASRTSGEMSATPGLSVKDALALGINPKVRVTGLTPEAIQQMLRERAMRNEQYSTGSIDPIAQQLMNRPEPE